MNSTAIGYPGSPLHTLPQAISGAILLLRNASQAGVPDLRRVAKDIVAIAESKPGEAADLLEAMKPQLRHGDGAELAQRVAGRADQQADVARQSKSASGLLLDVAQMALSIAGIFDPTPTCDALDGVISLMRGDYAGAAMSAVSMIPYLGDAAKLGKLGKLVDICKDVGRLVGVDAKLANEVVSTGGDISSALRRVQADSLSPSFADGLRRLSGAVDDMLGAAHRAAGRSGPPALTVMDARTLEHVRAPVVPDKFSMRDADQVLTYFGLQRISEHPQHMRLWREASAHLDLPGKNNVYKRTLDKLQAGQPVDAATARNAFKCVRDEFKDRFVKTYGHAPADVEHVINLGRHPELALDPRNLAVTSSIPDLGTKQHELLHWIKSGGDVHGDRRPAWLQIYSHVQDRFNAMTGAQAAQRVAEALAMLGR